MINEMKQLYEIIIEGELLTTKKLNEIGVTSSKINKLINKGIIERISRGFYKIVSMDIIYEYGIELQKNGDYKESFKCFEYCEKNGFSKKENNYQMMLCAIRDNNYDIALKYFDTCYMDSDYKLYNYIYIYLINKIVNVNYKYHKLLKNINYYSLKELNDNSSIKLKIQFINCICHNYYKSAFECLEKSILSKDNETVYDLILEQLLSRCNERYNGVIDNVKWLMKDKKYEDIIVYLNKVGEKSSLKESEQIILKLCNVIINIKQTRVIPKIIETNSKTFSSAIKCNDFKKALEIHKNKKKKENSTDVLNSMLVEINSLISEIKKEDVEKYSSKSIIDCLRSNDVDSVIEKLELFLEYYNKKEYNFLLLDIIKISSLKKDTKFNELRLILNSLEHGNFIFKNTYYLAQFYLELSKKNMEIAKVYIHILRKGNSIAECCPFVDSLEEILNDTVKLYNKISITSTSSEILTPESQKECEFVEQTTESADNTVLEVIEPQVVDQDIVPLVESIGIEDVKKKSTFLSEDEKYINGKFDILREKKGVLVLKTMKIDRKKLLEEMVYETNDIICFTIGTKHEKIVLCYAPMKNKYVDYKSVLSEVKELFSEHKYKKSIEANRKILETGRANASVYAGIGMAYIKTGNAKTAIDYLMIATELSRQNGKGEYDFTELIDKIRGKNVVEDEDKKYFVNIKETDFEEKSDYYGIKNIESITELVRNGMPIDDACNAYNLTTEQIMLVKLIYAKECYIEGNFELGDKYYRLVERTKGKTPFVQRQMTEIKNNKNFYMYREKESHKKLVLMPIKN